jgi:2-iminobutanoate/2-iminopropanoate deaminase
MDPATGNVVEGGIAEQTERALKNIAAILTAAGTDMSKVVRCGVFLKNMGEFTAMNDIYKKYFPAPPPARTTIEAARLPKDVLVEIDVIALA